MWRAEHQKTARETALEKEAIALKREGVTLHQVVASLQRKLESLEKERKDVLVRTADAMKGHFLAMFGPCVNSSKEHLFAVELLKLHSSE